MFKSLKVFNVGATNLGKTHLVEHRIETIGNPMKQYAHREIHKDCDIVRAKVKKMLEIEMARPSNSPWASPIILITNKDMTTRFCVDYI